MNVPSKAHSVQTLPDLALSKSQPHKNLQYSMAHDITGETKAVGVDSYSSCYTKHLQWTCHTSIISAEQL